MKNDNNLHHFLIGTDYGHSQHVSLNDSGEVVHSYEKNIFDKRSGNLSKDYAKFLEGIGLTVNNVFSKSTCTDSLEKAKMSLMVTQNLKRLDSSAKFNQLFGTGEQGDETIELSEHTVAQLEKQKEYMDSQIEKVRKGADL